MQFWEHLGAAGLFLIQLRPVSKWAEKRLGPTADAVAVVGGGDAWDPGIAGSIVNRGGTCFGSNAGP